jgi:transposase-like protein
MTIPLHQLAPGAEYDNEYNARLFLENSRWKGHPQCPHPGANGQSCSGRDDKLTLQKPGLRSNGKPTTFRTWKCNKCRKTFTVTVGTPFEGCRDLHKWLRAVKILIEHPGISRAELAEILDVNEKTATKMIKRLAKEIAQPMSENDDREAAEVEHSPESDKSCV